MDSSRIIAWDGESPPLDLIERIINALKRGSLVVAPTETRYGFLARHDSDIALERLYDAKGRPTSMPTAFFVRNSEEIRRYACVNEIAHRIMTQFLPGPLTIVLSAKVDWRPPRVVDGKIGFRWSTSKLIAALVTSVDFLLSATSANLTGRPELETVQDIERQFGDAADLYIDGGKLEGPVSTVVDCSAETPMILRAGAIPSEAIFESSRDHTLDE